jgi:hypothetical protein
MSAAYWVGSMRLSSSSASAAAPIAKDARTRSAAWGIPLALGPVDTIFKGFGNYTGSKGKDGSAVESKRSCRAASDGPGDEGRRVHERSGGLRVFGESRKKRGWRADRHPIGQGQQMLIARFGTGSTRFSILLNQ